MIRLKLVLPAAALLRFAACSARPAPAALDQRLGGGEARTVRRLGVVDDVGEQVDCRLRVRAGERTEIGFVGARAAGAARSRVRASACTGWRYSGRRHKITGGDRIG
jgi:hypothetical protein